MTQDVQKSLEDANRQVEALWDERDKLRSELDDSKRLIAELQVSFDTTLGLF